MLVCTMAVFLVSRQAPSTVSQVETSPASLAVTTWWQSVPGEALAMQRTGAVWPMSMWRGRNSQVSVDSTCHTITWPSVLPVTIVRWSRSR